MSINQAVHPKADVDRPYVDRNLGGKGLDGVHWRYVRIEENSLSDYIKRIERKDNSILDSFIKDQTAVKFNKNRNKNYEQYLKKVDSTLKK